MNNNISLLSYLFNINKKSKLFNYKLYHNYYKIIDKLKLYLIVFII
jgi:hypothetical protein